jgi:hypothetical protein
VRVAAAPSTIVQKPDEVDQQVWDDWKQLRKTKKAPVTDTVLKGAMTEAKKAGISLNEFLSIWCRRGSQGLEAAWLLDKHTKTAGDRNQTVLSGLTRGLVGGAGNVKLLG